MKPGTRLKSAVCDTEIMVIRAGTGDIAIACGGAQMAEQTTVSNASLDPAFAGGTQMGKRYINEADTIELLCVKPGQGSLSIDNVALQIKGSRALPSSD